MDAEDIVLTLLVPAAILTVIWMVWMVATTVRRRRAAQIQAELHGKLLDKLGSSQELLAYLETEAGQRMVQAVGDQADPAGRILNAMHVGVVLLMLGLGLVILFISLPGERVDVLLGLGIVSLSLGVGFLISSLLSYIFSKSWGLLNHSSPRR
jgi:hypothetical protein